MKFQISNFKFQILLIPVLLILYCLPAIAAEGKWSGVDETVVEKYAKEHGREPGEPLINTDKGDLLLFIFLLAGAAGGFAAGYSWRRLTERKPGDRDGNSGTAASKTAGS